MIQRPTPTETDGLSASTTSTLPDGAWLFAWSAREWVSCAIQQRDVHSSMLEMFQSVNCPDAIVLLDELMCLLAATAYKAVQIRCHCSTNLSEDEFALVNVLRALQQVDDQLATRELNQLMSERLCQSFFRPARLLLEILQRENLPISGVRHLRLVAHPSPAQVH